MKYNFTIFFTFFADGNIRRKYIEMALDSLFKKTDKDIPVIVIDASSKKDLIKNKKLFKDLSNLEYIHDQDNNPFTRCNKYLHLIKTDYVLRLLEDCVYVSLTENNFEYIKNDIKLLSNLSKINVIQYPIIDERLCFIKNHMICYTQINFQNKKKENLNGYFFYDRSQEEKIYHYLCNNILYRTTFFKKHWSYFSKYYTSHSSAEIGDICFKVNNFLTNNILFIKIIRVIVRFYEKLFQSGSIITQIAITETMKKADVIHIGYYSTEKNMQSNWARDNLDGKYEGISSTLENLRIFNKIEILDKLKFKRN